MRTNYSVPSSDAVSVMHFLLEHQKLTQRDLIPEFGSESAFSVFLSHERKLTLDQVRKLSSRFNLTADVLSTPAANPGLRPWGAGFKAVCATKLATLLHIHCASS